MPSLAARVMTRPSVPCAISPSSVGNVRFMRWTGARLLEARPPLDQRRGALDHDALQLRPLFRVEIDRDRDPRVLAQVRHLASVVAGSEVDLVTGHDVADGDEVRLAVTAGRGHPTHPLAS